MLFIISTLLIFIISIKLASLLGAVLLTVFFKLKQKSQGLSESDWNKYFETINTKGLMFRMYISYFVALTIFAVFNTIIFWNGVYGYGIALIIGGMFYTYSRYKQNKDKISIIFQKKDD
ncbi:hypothetical protein ACWOAH_03025 [Vagococcus vulneris]|uniref:Uncharacterized protein n=1 Tax=Vagococcus vulneris TaxID=1977869 RepID=A0A429ZXH7_9ENTE|nr:hypothetical protein [Vagococcus vulneris]RST98589.1 hypothetical protein CBF37_07380 [Vagococcus vulneris]